MNVTMIIRLGNETSVPATTEAFRELGRGFRLAERGHGIGVRALMAIAEGPPATMLSSPGFQMITQAGPGPVPTSETTFTFTTAEASGLTDTAFELEHFVGNWDATLAIKDISYSGAGAAIKTPQASQGKFPDYDLLQVGDGPSSASFHFSQPDLPDAALYPGVYFTFRQCVINVDAGALGLVLDEYVALPSDGPV